jgi:capsular exopolysaccharide synthesis family protein
MKENNSSDVVSIGGMTQDGAEPTLEGVLGTLRRRKGLIIGVALLGTILATLAGLQITPKYTSKALVMIEPREANIIGFKAVLTGLPADPTIVETEVKVLSSRDHLQRVIEELDLARDPEFRSAPAEAERDRSLLRRMGAWLPKQWLIAAGFAEQPALQRLEASDPASGPSGARAVAAAEENRILSHLARRLKVTQEGRSYVIGVSFASANPETAATVANAVAQLYVQAQAERKRQATAKASDWLGERVAALKDEVARAEAAMERYRTANNLAVAPRTDVNDQQVADLSKELIATQAELAGRQARLDFIRELRRQGRVLDTMPEVLGSPVIVELRRREAELSQTEAELATILGRKHPKMRLILAERQKLGEKIAREIDRITANLENEVRIAAARVGTIQAGLADAQRMRSQAQAAEVQLNELEREAQASRKLYENLLQRYKETKEQQAIVEPDAQIISTAAPGQPSSPGPPLFAAMGLTVSTLIGTMLAFLLERLDKGLRSEGDIQAALGLPRIGLIPRLNRPGRHQRPHQYLLLRPLSAYAEAIRMVFARLCLGNAGQPSKLILVTSSVPGEGKTTLAVSLAVYAAQAGQRVLLLDLDLRHPSVQRELSRSVAGGIVEHLLHDVPLEEVIDHDPELGLDVISVREQATDPMLLLTSRRMGELLRRLRDDYDHVIIDSPPLLGLTEAQLLASMVDKVLVVVQWTKTARSLAQNAVGLLRSVKADIAGVVLTQVHVNKHARYRNGDVGSDYKKYRAYYQN